MSASIDLARLSAIAAQMATAEVSASADISAKIKKLENEIGLAKSTCDTNIDLLNQLVKAEQINEETYARGCADAEITRDASIKRSEAAIKQIDPSWVSGAAEGAKRLVAQIEVGIVDGAGKAGDIIGKGSAPVVQAFSNLWDKLKTSATTQISVPKKNGIDTSKLMDLLK